MIIEVVGIPGAGKSTISQMLADRLDLAWRELNLDGRERHRARLAGLITQPRMLLGLASRIRHDRVGPAISAILHLTGRSFVQRRLSDTVVDSGPVFTASVALVNGAPNVTPALLAKWLPNPDLIVHLHQSPEVAARRVIERGRFTPYTEAQLVERFDSYEHHLKALVELLPCERMVVDVGDLTPEEVTDRCLDLLRTQGGSR